MRPRTLLELAQAIGCEVRNDSGVVVTGISTDSRAVEPGDLFVAISGETHDGNRFIGKAIAAGAVAAVTSDPELEGIPSLVVSDTLQALRDIAVLHRDDLNMPVVAITGSTGKTSTKDLLAGALPGAWASPRSFNNEVGVPLTILRTPLDARFLVAEVGSRGRGHIEFLMPAVRPDVAIVTNLGVVHLETFGTTEVLADSKFELVEALDDTGTAVLPAGEPRLRRPHRGTTVTFGKEPSADVHIGEVALDEVGFPSFRLDAAGESAAIRLRMAGAHQALNAAAAVGAGLAVGVGFADLVAGLEQATGSQWRMEIHRGRYTVVNDAYNANPDSTEAAMRTVAAIPGRHIAVLGKMAELGSLEASEHGRIGRLASELGFAAVVTVGEDPGIAAAAGPLARNVADVEMAHAVVSAILREGDVLLVKASRAVGLESLALRMAEEAQQ
ncbi:MAG: UDP-N-acetylmuramoyl-tripeptide--D-alanyl-D-alanine ligase [Acidimicrobiia bacterium]|nr:UDP-N-acetylmuramoyl-tripeptide--D-alanyl-D-alanine ligase [Acidimicrobiia bacterium]